MLQLFRTDNSYRLVHKMSILNMNFIYKKLLNTTQHKTGLYD